MRGGGGEGEPDRTERSGVTRGEIRRGGSSITLYRLASDIMWVVSSAKAPPLPTVAPLYYPTHILHSNRRPPPLLLPQGTRGRVPGAGPPHRQVPHRHARHGQGRTGAWLCVCVGGERGAAVMTQCRFLTMDGR